MSKMPPMDGLYNIEEDPTTGYTYHRTASRLPTPERFDEECGELANLLRCVVSDFLKGGNFPEYNDVLDAVFEKYSVGEFPSDRTMCFFVGDLDAFTPAFVRILQERVLSEYPLWRLLAQFEGKKIGIYREGAWLGDEWVEGVFDGTDPAYVRWLEDAKACREKCNGPLRRQLAYVRNLIPAAMPDARRSGFSVLAAFDCYQPHFPGHAVWLLQWAAAGEMYLDVGVGPIPHCREFRFNE
jgi:hypothetical protein